MGISKRLSEAEGVVMTLAALLKKPATTTEEKEFLLKELLSLNSAVELYKRSYVDKKVYRARIFIAKGSKVLVHVNEDGSVEVPEFTTHYLKRLQQRTHLRSLLQLEGYPIEELSFIGVVSRTDKVANFVGYVPENTSKNTLIEKDHLWVSKDYIKKAFEENPQIVKNFNLSILYNGVHWKNK